VETRERSTTNRGRVRESGERMFGDGEKGGGKTRCSQKKKTSVRITKNLVSSINGGGKYSGQLEANGP